LDGKIIKLSDSEGNPFDAYVSKPKGGRGPAVVVGLDVHGLRPLYQDMADAWAERGYLVIVPDYYWDATRGADHTYLDSFKMSTGIEVTKSAMEAGRIMPECNGKVLTTGYCMGGNTALLSVMRLGADASASYYGTLMHDYLDEFKSIKQPILLHMPEHDWTYTEAQRDKIIAEARKNSAITVHIYPEPHGFATGRRKPNGAGDLSDTRTFELFDKFR
jgi:carboxymethylenebutenolidase